MRSFFKMMLLFIAMSISSHLLSQHQEIVYHKLKEYPFEKERGSMVLPGMFNSALRNALDNKNKVSDDEWSGTITFLHLVRSKVAGQYSATIYNEYEVYNEHRMEATFNLGNGTGQQSTHYSERKLNRERIVNKVVEDESNTISQSFGSGASHLSINVDEDEKTYFIEASIPQSNGQSATTYSCKGCIAAAAPQKSKVMQEETMILVEDQKLGDNPNVLSGEIREETTVDGTVDLLLIQWSFIKGPVEVELIVTPQDYINWLPLPGKSEREGGSTLPIRLKIKGKGGQEPTLKVKQFELELQNTSKEPGIAINYPKIVSEPLFDLSFKKSNGASVTNEGQSAIIQSSDGVTGNVEIESFDGGGYATLIATAVLEGGFRVRGQLEKPGGTTQILLPKRKDGSLIGEAWGIKNGNPKDDDDIEKTEGNVYHGDGLTAYEEYRGVFSKGNYLRLNPKRKDLGVQLEKRNEKIFEDGIALLSKAADIDVITLYEDEAADDHSINANSKTHHQTIQHVLKLLISDLDIAGKNEPITKLKKTPKDSEAVLIGVTNLKQFQNELESAYKLAGNLVPFTLEENIAVTVAHELAHGIGIDHHGPRSHEINRVIGKYEKDMFNIYGIDMVKIDSATFTIDGKIGITGNDSSGDLLCIMAYNSYYQWVYYKGKDGIINYYAVPPLQVGNRLCTSSAGTGINSKGYFGNATTGNCMAQLKIKDE